MSDETTPGREHRAHFRVRTTRPVVCYPVDAHGVEGEEFPAETVDLSVGGVAVRAGPGTIVPLGLYVRFSFDDPTLDLTVGGPVVRSEIGADGVLLAVRFVAHRPDDQRDLTRFIFREAQHLNQLGSASG